jgi:hypothetical protein
LTLVLAAGCGGDDGGGGDGTTQGDAVSRARTTCNQRSIVGLTLNRAVTGREYHPVPLAGNLDKLSAALKDDAPDYADAFTELARLLRGGGSGLETKLRERMTKFAASLPDEPATCKEIVEIDG